MADLSQNLYDLAATKPNVSQNIFKSKYFLKKQFHIVSYFAEFFSRRTENVKIICFFLLLQKILFLERLILDRLKYLCSSLHNIKRNKCLIVVGGKNLYFVFLLRKQNKKKNIYDLINSLF